MSTLIFMLMEPTQAFGRILQPPVAEWLKQNPKATPSSAPIASHSYRRHLTLAELLDGSRHSNCKRKVGR